MYSVPWGESMPPSPVNVILHEGRSKRFAAGRMRTALPSVPSSLLRPAGPLADTWAAALCTTNSVAYSACKEFWWWFENIDCERLCSTRQSNVPAQA